MRPIKVLIADDEPLAHKVLEGYIEKIDGLVVAGNCFDGMSTLNFLHKNEVDLVLLDIQMPDITGLELLDSLKNHTPKVIFTTAYTDYAIQGFEYDQVIDYLHKPIRLTRFIKAIERTRKIRSLENNAQVTVQQSSAESGKQSSEYIYLKDNKTTYRILYSDIVVIKSWGNYLKVVLKNEEVKLIRKTIKAMESELPADQFLRIHKSYIVNISDVKAIEENQLILKNDTLPIGKSYLVLTRKRILS